MFDKLSYFILFLCCSIPVLALAQYEVVSFQLKNRQGEFVQTAVVRVNNSKVELEEKSIRYRSKIPPGTRFDLEIIAPGYLSLHRKSLGKVPHVIEMLREDEAYSYDGTLKRFCFPNDDRLAVIINPGSPGKISLDSAIAEGGHQVDSMVKNMGWEVIYQYDSHNSRASDAVRNPYLLNEFQSADPTPKSPFQDWYILAPRPKVPNTSPMREVLRILRTTNQIRFAGPFISRNVNLDFPGMYTGAIFFEFVPRTTTAQVERLFEKYNLTKHQISTPERSAIALDAGLSRKEINLLIEELQEHPTIVEVVPGTLIHRE